MREQSAGDEAVGEGREVGGCEEGGDAMVLVRGLGGGGKLGGEEGDAGPVVDVELRARR